MKRRRFLMLTLFSVMLLMLCMGVACGKSQTKKPDQIEYVHVSNLNSYGECDDFMTIDGKFDEANWQNLNWFHNTFISNTGDNNTPSIDVTTFFTKKGVYIAAVITDIDMKYSGDMRPWNNTVIEFYYYVHKDGKTLPVNTWVDSSKYYYSIIDLGGELYGKSKTVMRGVTYEGEINVGNGKTANFELFIEWDKFGLNVETDDQIPEAFYMLPNARMALGGADRNTILCAPRNDMGRVVDYFKFDKNGYANADDEKSILGSNKFGSTKSAGWVTKDCKEGIDARLSHGVDAQWLYFKESYDENFCVSADIGAKGGTMTSVSGWSGRYVGMSIVSPSGAYRNIQFDYRTTNVVESENYLHLRNVTLLRDYSYEKPWSTVLVEPVSGFKCDNNIDFYNLTVIKKGTELYYFVNGNYYAKENLTILDGKVFVALMNWNTIAEVKNCEYRAMTESETEKLLAEKGFYTVTILSNRGGTVSVNGSPESKVSVSSDETVSAEFTCKTNYKISKVQWNGVPFTEQQMKEFVGGKYNFGSITENSVLETEFAELDEKTVFKGSIKNKNSKISADMILVNKENPSIKYNIHAGRASGFNVSIACGKYSIYVMSDDGDDSCIISEIDLTETSVPVEKDIQVYSSYNFIYDETTKTAESVSNEKVYNVSNLFLDENAGFITNADDSFMISYRAKAEECKYPCVGFTVIDKDGHSVQFYFGTNRLQFANRWSDICVPMNFSPDKQYSIENGAKISLVYNKDRDVFFMYANDEMIYRVSRTTINEYINKVTANDAYKVGSYFSDGSYRIGIAAFQVEPLSDRKSEKPLLSFNEFYATTDKTQIESILPDLCKEGYHVDNNNDGKCDSCGVLKIKCKGSVSVKGEGQYSDLSDTVLKFKNAEKVFTFNSAVKTDGKFELELWQGTYSVTAINEILNSAVGLSDIKVENEVINLELVLLPSLFTDETKNATAQGNCVSISKNGYAYLNGNGSSAYLKVTFNITNAHQGITIYTDSVNGKNAQICFQHKGYSLLKNYTWATTDTGNVFSNNGLLGLKTDVLGEHTVEYFIIEGKLYIIYDGVNCFDKPLVLSNINGAFNSNANYHIGIYNYDGNYTLADTIVHEIMFGSEAIKVFNDRKNQI